MSTCRSCSHAKFAHQHYRRGTDCSGCDCAAFRSLPMPLAKLVKPHARPKLRVASAAQGDSIIAA